MNNETNEKKIIILGKVIREKYCSGMTARITDKTFDLPLYNISNWGDMKEVKTEYGKAQKRL